MTDDLAQRGPAFLLKVGDGGRPPAYATVAGLRQTAFSLTNNQLSVAGQGVFVGTAAETRLKGNALSGVLDDYELSFEDGSRYRGRFLVTRLDYAGDFNGDRSYAVSLDSSGEVSAL